MRATDALAFFDPRDAADVAAALAWLDAEERPAAEYGLQPLWSVLALPEPRLHPRAPALFAAAAGIAPAAIAAVLDGRAFVDDDGELRLWPWYPEEDEGTRPLAQRQAEALSVALPRELLDKPFEPAHYLARSGQEALARFLHARGIDAASARIARVPIPPRKSYPDERFEGGMKARSRVAQAVSAAALTTRIYEYVGSDSEQRAQLGARLDGDLARLCDRVVGAGASSPAPRERRQTEAPGYPEPVPVGRIVEVFVLRDGALLVTDGALIAIDGAGQLASAWRRPYGAVFARGDLVFVNTDSVLDLAARAWLSGELDPLLARVDLAEVPGTGGHDERTMPVLSACGRYLLDVDESPFIVRLADQVTVAEGQALEKAMTPLTKIAAGLVAVGAVAVGDETILDGVRFVVRGGEPPVRDGRSLAFALAGARWRFLTGSTVREGSRIIARLGVPVLGGAFSPDGATLWALGSDHALRVVFDPDPRVVAIVPLEPVLRAAARALDEEAGRG